MAIFVKQGSDDVSLLKPFWLSPWLSTPRRHVPVELTKPSCALSLAAQPPPSSSELLSSHGFCSSLLPLGLSMRRFCGLERSSCCLSVCRSFSLHLRCTSSSRKSLMKPPRRQSVPSSGFLWVQRRNPYFLHLLLCCVSPQREQTSLRTRTKSLISLP